jgi:hypothetical protein
MLKLVGHRVTFCRNGFLVRELLALSPNLIVCKLLWKAFSVHNVMPEPLVRVSCESQEEVTKEREESKWKVFFKKLFLPPSLSFDDDLST